MRFLKLVLISIVMLCIALIFVFALFPADIRISRVINITAPREKIAAVVADCSTWDKWNHFFNNHPPEQVSSPPAGEGAFIRSNGVSVSIVSSSADSVTMEWTQTNGKKFHSGFNFVQLQPGVVTVEWYFHFHFHWYPWEKLGSMFYDKQLGPLMEKSLTDLKNYTGNR